jgi:hypothetical protein
VLDGTWLCFTVTKCVGICRCTKIILALLQEILSIGIRSFERTRERLSFGCREPNEPYGHNDQVQQQYCKYCQIDRVWIQIQHQDLSWNENHSNLSLLLVHDTHLVLVYQPMSPITQNMLGVDQWLSI